MIKLTSIFLSLLVFTQSLSSYVGTFDEVETLLEHAKVHADTYGDNIVVFLSKHYGELRVQHLKENNDTNGDHEKLPFTHQNCSHSIAALNLTVTTLLPDNPIPVVDTTGYFNYSNLYTSLDESGIFQPPQFT